MFGLSDSKTSVGKATGTTSAVSLTLENAAVEEMTHRYRGSSWP